MVRDDAADSDTDRPRTPDPSTEPRVSLFVSYR
jgi:hypothetical protein